MHGEKFYQRPFNAWDERGPSEHGWSKYQPLHYNFYVIFPHFF